MLQDTDTVMEDFQWSSYGYGYGSNAFLGFRKIQDSKFTYIMLLEFKVVCFTCWFSHDIVKVF